MSMRTVLEGEDLREVEVIDTDQDKEEMSLDLRRKL